MENKTGIRPIRNYLLIRVLPEVLTDGGLHLPQGVRLKNRALVMAVGSGHITDQGVIVPLEPKPGDFVTVTPESPMAVVEKDNENGDLVLIREDGIAAIDTRNDQLESRPTLVSVQ